MKKKRVESTRSSKRETNKLEFIQIKNRIESELPRTIHSKWAVDSSSKAENKSEPQESKLSSILTAFRFSQLPLSAKTQGSLTQKKWTNLSYIQKAVLPYALAGFDVIGEAPTGSGKTLAYLIPVIELLWREKWSTDDGLGAMIIAPTRELSLQIFDVLKQFDHHDVSAIAVFGGKYIDEEKKRIGRMNIVIGTPGRIQQHLEETPNLFVNDMRMLVLDEVDKLIEFGFMETVKSIVECLPSKETRQTLMFSATISPQARQWGTSFCRAENCIQVSSVSEEQMFNQKLDVSDGHLPVATAASKIQHTYCIMSLANKLSTLYSFLCKHFRLKILVFVSSIKQCRFIYETFFRLKTGARLLEMHGGQDQNKRLNVFDEFNRSQKAITLIATDVVGRGVDFPNVDWVIQLDCPPDIDTYIHRVGRTARGIKEVGNGCLFLLPSEEAFVQRMQEKGLIVKQVNVRVGKHNDISGKLASLNARNHDISHLAIKAYTSYLKSITLMRDGEIFKPNLMKNDLDGFAVSLGLAEAPELIFDLQAKEIKSLRGSGVCGAVTIDSMQKSTKNKSKLERLKEKIQAKKEEIERQTGEKRISDEDDLKEERKNSKTAIERRRERVKELRLRNKSLNDEEETFQISTLDTSKTQVLEKDPDWRMNPAVQKAIRKQRIVIRADGTAKIKGAAKLIPNKHLFFDDKDEAHDTTTFEGLAASLNTMPTQSDSDDVSDEEIQNAKTEREKFLLRVKKSLESTKADDRKRHRDARQNSKTEARTKKAKVLDMEEISPLNVTDHEDISQLEKRALELMA